MPKAAGKHPRGDRHSRGSTAYPTPPHGRKVARRSPYFTTSNGNVPLHSGGHAQYDAAAADGKPVDLEPDVYELDDDTDEAADDDAADTIEKVSGAPSASMRSSAPGVHSGAALSPASSPKSPRVRGTTTAGLPSSPSTDHEVSTQSFPRSRAAGTPSATAPVAPVQTVWHEAAPRSAAAVEPFNSGSPAHHSDFPAAIPTVKRISSVDMRPSEGAAAYAGDSGYRLQGSPITRGTQSPRPLRRSPSREDGQTMVPGAVSGPDGGIVPGNKRPRTAGSIAQDDTDTERADMQPATVTGSPAQAAPAPVAVDMPTMVDISALSAGSRRIVQELVDRLTLYEQSIRIHQLCDTYECRPEAVQLESVEALWCLDAAVHAPPTTWTDDTRIYVPRWMQTLMQQVRDMQATIDVLTAARQS